MADMKKYAIAVSGLLFCCLLLSWFWTHDRDLQQEKYQAVQPGMTLSEVKAIWGTPYYFSTETMLREDPETGQSKSVNVSFAEWIVNDYEVFDVIVDKNGIVKSKSNIITVNHNYSMFDRLMDWMP